VPEGDDDAVEAAVENCSYLPRLCGAVEATKRQTVVILR